ncbi:serine dehydratase-like isoform X1 [Dreissena polymorpha]|nr:serine dehydratase-like isoform X1 [Dreissena polymorpha]XP_052226899.1 serine dehydratase-like isoform X1 [Dreissena polymorpha]
MSHSGSRADGPLHMVTPTIRSFPISAHAGYDVFLKLDNLQIPGSFKIRGIGNLMKKASQQGCKKVVCASGGNAGLAAAYGAKMMGLPATIVLPQSTPAFVADKLRNEFGAEVEIVGKVWDESNAYAINLAKQPDILYVHPFDHPDIWEGHSTLIEEAAKQLPCKPDVVIVSVGGGGLLNGLFMGMQKVGWGSVPCVAMETRGADSFNAAVKNGKLVTLPDITSVAKCLGALTVSAKSLELAQQYQNIHSVVINDAKAVDACLKFADDHRYLVEPACGASLAAVYGDVIKGLQKEGKLGEVKTALVVVCGGSSVTLKQLETWRDMFHL